ncbi:TrgA family protein [Tritonibacter aquimaris]
MPTASRMPTATRMIAAILLAFLAFVVSGQVMPLLPEGTDFGYFTHVNMGLAIVVGWVYMGRRVGDGFVPALNNGLTGVALLVLFALFAQGAWEMFRMANRNFYDGPFEALGAIFEIALDFFFVIAVPKIWATLIVGGCMIGLVAENISKRWK